MKITPASLSNVTLEPSTTVTPTQVAPPDPPSAAATLSSLKLELARRQLELVPAQAYVREAIAKVARLKSDAKLELQVDAAFRAGDASAAARVLDGALAAGGVPSLAMAISIFEAQAPAWLAAAEAGAQVEALLNAVAGHALALLARRPALTDHAAALASMVAANRALGCGRSLFASYSPIDGPVANCDAFTNEPGFPDLAAKVEVKGGAVVGVSGALLELGARGAELVVSVDANPSIQKIMLLLSGLLLVADQKAQAQGLNEQQQAEVFMARLERGASAETTEELKALGYPADMLREVDAQLDALKAMLARGAIRGWRMPKAVWCKGPDAAQHIRHLTRLALEGKIVAVSADLADREVVARINKVLDMFQVDAKVFHFSNALDYIPNIKGTFSNFEQVHRADTAVITTTAYFLRDAGQRLQQTELTDALGTLDAPAALKASDWFGRRADQLHALVWQDVTHRQRLTRDTYSRMGKGTQQFPDNYEAYLRQVENDRPR